jgi:hypothetical protein
MLKNAPACPAYRQAGGRQASAVSILRKNTYSTFKKTLTKAVSFALIGSIEPIEGGE